MVLSLPVSAQETPTLLFCISLLAPFFRRTTAASTLFTAAAQCSADLPTEEDHDTQHALVSGKSNSKQPFPPTSEEARVLVACST